MRLIWTFEKLQKEALKFKSRGEFQKYSKNAEQSARKRKMVDEIRIHLKPSNTTSIPEKTILKEIKIIYPTAKKLVDRKVKISNSSHIKGFDIDIFVPELNRGIEFDGNWSHSFQGLKRGRPHWPDDDIFNYHKIKDSWFASKGIQILHIKEEDWNKNKEECIKKCLEFLENPNEL